MDWARCEPSARFHSMFAATSDLSRWLGLGVILCLSCVGQAATIFVGDHELAPNDITLVPIMIQRDVGDPDLLGVELALQIADGSVGPRIAGVDLVNGTIFESNNTGSRDKGSLPWQAFWETTTAAGTVPIPETGLLATVEIDASDWTSGTFDLKLTSVAGASTVLFDDMANSVVPNSGAEIRGSITVVPEPTGLLLCAGFVLLFRFRRRLRTL